MSWRSNLRIGKHCSIYQVYCRTPIPQLQYLQQNRWVAMKIFPENIASFRGVSEYESHYGDGLAINSNNVDQNCQLKNTESDDIRGLDLDCFLRLSKKSLDKQEISFQKDFLLEHLTSFRNLIQNLLEFAHSTVKGITTTDNLGLAVEQGQSQKSQNLNAILNTSSLVLSSDDRDIFIQDLPGHPDLQAFFDQILKFQDKRLVAELITITISLWREMRVIDFKFIERKELLKKADIWSSKHARESYNRDGFLYINFKNLSLNDKVSQELIFDKFSHFFKFFVTTVLFIVAGFFQNPYAKQGQEIQSDDEVDYPKRQLSLVSFGFLSSVNDFSDSDQIFEPKKKLKQ